ncbi:LysM peptidoglycan-binding domain-containing protein [Aliiroseovarius sp. YM-037]|uniref:LysM peptidoglycan-binding domain-containing protein n=1 Tax=Aliiroseovarius sp. YM-037 TaxID=3341728 RepID=UPI003A803C9F
MVKTSPKLARALFVGTALGGLAACDGGFDLDMRDNFNGFDTSGAVRQVTAPRPTPDNRGVISYPNYQVVVAQRDETIRGVASRIGVNAEELGRYNGISPDTPLRSGEIVALPTRVAEPSPATGAIATGPIRPADQIDVQTLAGNAIDRGPDPSQPRVIGQTPPQTRTAAASPSVQTGEEPTRHKVKRGETAYSISRRYGVSVQSLAEWNGLGADLMVREGQFLLIPVASQSAPAPTRETTSAPGQGSPTPTPPSASEPLPEDDTTPVAEIEAPESPDLGTERTEASGGGALLFPVSGNIIRPYAAGQNSGIDIAASAGSAVKAAEAGTVAAITQNTDEVPVLVIRHADNLLTVYANISDITVSKGDSVSRGQQFAKVRSGDPSFMRFEVRRGLDAVDPMPLLN